MMRHVNNSYYCVLLRYGTTRGYVWGGGMRDNEGGIGELRDKKRRDEWDNGSKTKTYLVFKHFTQA